MTDKLKAWQTNGDLRRGLGGKFFTHPTTGKLMWLTKVHRDGREIYVGGKWKIHSTAYIADGSIIMNSTIHCHARVEAGAVIVDSWVEAWTDISDWATVVNSSVKSCASMGFRARLIDSTLPPDALMRACASVTGAGRNLPRVTIPEDVLIDIPNGANYMSLEVRTHRTLRGLLAQTPDKEWRLTLGCWEGTLREFEAMIATNYWVDTLGAQQTAMHRPRMEELIADMKRWIEAQETDGN